MKTFALSFLISTEKTVGTAIEEDAHPVIYDLLIKRDAAFAIVKAVF